MNNMTIAAVLAVALLLQGCDSAEETQTKPVKPTVAASTQTEAEESYQCNTKQTSFDVVTWCEASVRYDDEAILGEFSDYLSGFRLGYSDAAMAADPKPANGTGDIVDDGYQAGYHFVAHNLGLRSYECNDPADEYEKLWCVAAQAYEQSGAGHAHNVFVRARFIDGFLAGGRVALSTPATMESFFAPASISDNSMMDKLPAGANVAETAFHRGFDDGHQAMLNDIRNSINQMMQQIQLGGGMATPDAGMQVPFAP